MAPERQQLRTRIYPGAARDSFRLASLVCLFLVAVAPSARGSGPLDSDGDGVPDNADDCVFASDADQTDSDGDLVGDACDRCPASTPELPGGLTGDRLITDVQGCAVTQRCPCVGPANRPTTWRTRHRYLQCIHKAIKALVRIKRLDRVGAHLVAAASRSSACGTYRGRAGDRDGDGIPEDGDGSMVEGDNPCRGGNVIDCDDNCPDRRNERQADQDEDGKGDVCDKDMDGDGVSNRVDNCPRKRNEDQHDGDDDGVGDACDRCIDSDVDAEVDGRGCD